jgi:hypothetical protein
MSFEKKDGNTYVEPIVLRGGSLGLQFLPAFSSPEFLIAVRLRPQYRVRIYYTRDAPGKS